MVEQVRVNPEEVRGYGNICEGHTLEDFIVSNSGLAKEKENVHGTLTDVYKLVYSLYGLMFDFDVGNKQLYLQMEVADVLSFGFDEEGKQLYLVDEDDTGLSLGFDEDTNELYITDEAPPVVHDYSLALDSESYTTSGSLSVSATLLDDGVAVSGATVSFTGGVSTVTATTNSSGVATATVTFSASGTLTATYSNVSDTATVTVQSYLFYDACDSASGLSNYGTPIGVGSNITQNYTEYNSTQNAYYVHTDGDWGIIPITALTGADNYKISMLVKTKSTNGASRCGFGFLPANNTNTFPCWKVEGNGVCNYTLKSGSSEPNTKVCDTTSPNSNWYKIEVSKQGTSYTCKVYNSSDTLLGTHTTTVDLGTGARMGLYLVGGTSYGGYVKEIKAEAL